MYASPLAIRLFFLATLLLITGCAPSTPAAKAPPAGGSSASTVAAAQTQPPAATEALESTGTCRDEQAIRESERNRASCYHLQPASGGGKKSAKLTKGKGGKITATAVKTKGAQGKSAKKKGKAPAGPAEKTEHRVSGMCQPQSLIYARCRTGINSCRLGNTSPVQWFACAKSGKNTTSIPTVGSVLVLDANTRRGMPTGHPVYVEEVKKNQDGTWSLRISHTNYDRKCHLDLDAKVLYDPRHLTASFLSGPWATWAKDLKALGFILR